MSINLERIVPELKHIEEEDLKDVILKGEYQLLENELALLDLGSLGLNLNEINEQQTTYIFNYLDNEMTNTYTGRKTKGDFLNSFVMSFDNGHEISEHIWSVNKRPISFDKEGNELDWENVVTISDFLLFRKWKMRATKYWNDNNLNNYVKGMKDLLLGNINRGQLLEDAIFSDAIDENVSERLRIESRKQAINILGLDKTKTSTNFNVFTSGGGKDMADALKDYTGSSSNPLDYIGNEIEVVDE